MKLFSPNVKILSKDADAAPPTITVDGGQWSTDGGSRFYTNEQYPLDSSLGDWGDVFGSDANAFMQWGADDSGTTGTVDPDINADGVVAVFFDPPLTGDFAIRMNFASASIAFFGYDADSVTSVPTPVSQDSNWQSYSFGEVVNLRYVSIKRPLLVSNLRLDIAH